MYPLRLLADDLTGALDTSAELVGAFGPLAIYWSVDEPLPGGTSFAFDSGTRELGATQAAAVVRRLTPLLCEAATAFKKIDSLLRGPWVAEIAACLQAGSWDACIVAPAFAHQGRRTCGGQQYARSSDGSWSPVGGNLVEELRRQNIETRLADLKADSEADLQPGVSVFDAETDQDLDRIVEIGRRYGGKILWCGAGGLAAALARGTQASIPRTLKAPVLGVFGSDHPATEAQLEACQDIVIRATEGRLDLDRIKQRLDQGCRAGAADDSWHQVADASRRAFCAGSRAAQSVDRSTGDAHHRRRRDAESAVPGRGGPRAQGARTIGAWCAQICDTGRSLGGR